MGIGQAYPCLKISCTLGALLHAGQARIGAALRKHEGGGAGHVGRRHGRPRQQHVQASQAGGQHVHRPAP